MRPLAEYAASMRSTLGADYPVPDFDPCDGGADSRLLILLEAPGRKAVSSGFVSRNNPDPTAKNLCLEMAAVGLPRGVTAIWNIIPWYVGTPAKIRPVLPSDLRRAWPYTAKLLPLLPRLEVVLLLGRKAQSAAPLLQQAADVLILIAPHTSGQVFNTRPELRADVRKALGRAAAQLGYHAAS